MLQHQYKLNREIPIQIETLDGVLGSESLEEGVLVKIDTEGADEAVLQGGMKFLKRHRPAIFCERVSPALEKQMSGLGYTVFQVQSGATDRFLVPGASKEGKLLRKLLGEQKMHSAS